MGDQLHFFFFLHGYLLVAVFFVKSFPCCLGTSIENKLSINVCLFPDKKSYSIDLNVYTMQVGWKDSREKGKATHSRILAWRIPWTEESGRLHSMGSQTVVQD